MGPSRTPDARSAGGCRRRIRGRLRTRLQTATGPAVGVATGPTAGPALLGARRLTLLIATWYASGPRVAGLHSYSCCGARQRHARPRQSTTHCHVPTRSPKRGRAVVRSHRNRARERRATIGPMTSRRGSRPTHVRPRPPSSGRPTPVKVRPRAPAPGRLSVRTPIRRSRGIPLIGRIALAVGILAVGAGVVYLGAGGLGNGRRCRWARPSRTSSPA